MQVVQSVEHLSQRSWVRLIDYARFNSVEKTLTRIISLKISIIELKRKIYIFSLNKEKYIVSNEFFAT